MTKIKIAFFFLCLLSPFFLLPLHAEEKPSCSSVRIVDNGRDDVAVLNGIFSSLLSFSGRIPLIVLVKPKNSFSRVKNHQADVFLAAWQKVDDAQIQDNDLIHAPNALFPHAQYALAVPSYLEKKGLSSIRQIPQFKKSLNSTLFSVEESQQTLKAITHLITSDTQFSGFSISSLKEADTTSFIETMTKKRQDFVILAWEPHINNALFDLAFLAQDNLNPESPPLFPTDSLFAVTRKNYPETCPQVTRLIHQLQVSRPLIHFLMAQHLIHKKPLHDTFIQWLHEHKRFLATSLTGIKTLDGKNAFLAALQTLLLSRKTSPEPE